MFTIQKDYFIKNSNTPVLMRQADGHFEPVDCYFLEFPVKKDIETIKKIERIYSPFDFSTAVQLAITNHRTEPYNIQRLFLLGAPDILQNNFQEPDDFLAFALCDDGPKSTKIQYFEVNYNFRHSYDPSQKYNHVGTSALDALKGVYWSRELYGKSALEARKFWTNNGFTRIEGQEELCLSWRSQR